MKIFHFNFRELGRATSSVPINQNAEAVTLGAWLNKTMKKLTTTLQPPPRRSKVIFHRNGSLDFRGANQRRWIRGLDQLSVAEYMSLPYPVRHKIILVEFSTGRSLVAGSPVIVSRPVAASVIVSEPAKAPWDISLPAA